MKGKISVGQKFVDEPARKIPVSHEADVIVAGGGTAGVATAVCAARLGLSVVMIEMSAIPGGMVTHVTNWLNDFDNKGGFPKEFLEQIKNDGICEYPVYNPFRVVPYFDHLIEDAGIRPLYLARAVAPVMGGSRLTGVIMESKSGRTAVTAKVVIDATGDGDLAARAGAAFCLGRDSDGERQAVSLTQMLTNYTGGRIDVQRMNQIVAEGAKKAGVDYECPYDHYSSAPLTSTQNVLMHTIAHAAGYDMLSADGVSDCLIEMRKQARDLFTVLKNTREFGSVEFGPFSAIPGIRESRRIICDARVTDNDALSGAKCEDGLFQVTQAIDIHRCAEGEPAITVEQVQPYHIPYGALLPKGLENILVVGRCIGGDHKALASYRIIADCFAMGEAAAIAANTAIKAGVSVRDIDAVKLAGEMKTRGYLV